MNEAETRQKIIDANLRLAGWNVNDPSQVIQELDIYLAHAGVPVPADLGNPYCGHQFADYALLLHGKPACERVSKALGVQILRLVKITGQEPVYPVGRHGERRRVGRRRRTPARGTEWR